ncbi:MAG: hypothetical protein KDA93_19640 [Planctomycetaceae bacterium]|nr:hypothetical protein [Planctomycetaceae bacterium]
MHSIRCPKKLVVAGRYFLFCGLLTALTWTTSGCSPKGPKPVNQKDVVPVTGTVHVDGAPEAGVDVRLVPHPFPADRKVPLVMKGRTGADGKFQITTYYQNDGAPVGEYGVLFEKDLTPAADPTDQFQGKYSVGQEPIKTISVTGSEEEGVDMGIIELESP